MMVLNCSLLADSRGSPYPFLYTETMFFRGVYALSPSRISALEK